MKQLFVTDLDGTFLNRESLVSTASANLISDLSRRGALITVATARTPATVEPLLHDTLTTPPAIVMTGAAMWDRSTKSFLNPCFIPQTSAGIIIGLCRRHGIAPFSYTITETSTIDTFYDGNPTPHEQKFIDERTGLCHKRMHIHRNPAKLPDSYPSTLLIFALGQSEKIYPLADDLRRTGLCSVSSYPDIFNPSTAYLEVFAPGVSKAAAVSRLKTDTGADRLIVFGDNLNDLPMMEVADVAVAVDNALPQVKEAADVIIGPNTSDSVARFIEKQFG